MELRHLRYFVAVAEELHMSRAAQRLHISQPPLSQQISALEEEIGTPLFDRVGRGIRLNAAGSAFLEHARRTLAMAEQGIAVARQVGRGQSGSLSVGYVSSLTYTYLPRILERFQIDYPDVRLELREMSVVGQVRALEERSLQLGLLRSPLQSSFLVLHPLLSEPFIVALPAQHRLAARRSIPVADLRDEPFIMFPRYLGGMFYSQVWSLCRKRGFEPRVVQEVTQTHAAVGLVSAGLGVALVPASTRALKIDGVTFRAIDDTDITTEIAVATAEDNRSPIVRNFARIAAQAVAETRLPGSDTPPPANSPPATPGS